jgi:uncharacterized protein
MKYDEEFLEIANKKHFSDAEKEEVYSIINEIIEHEIWKKMKQYKHHIKSRSIHMLNVCLNSYRVAKKKGLDIKSISVAAISHDLFLYDWKDPSHYLVKPTKLTERHAFTHPMESLKVLKKYFPHLVNEKVENIILCHMWPLSNKMPKYKESWIVTMSDKKDSLEVFKNIKELPMYIGLFKKKK